MESNHGSEPSSTRRPRRRAVLYGMSVAVLATAAGMASAGSTASAAGIGAAPAMIGLAVAVRKK